MNCDGKFAGALDSLASVLGEELKADVLGGKGDLTRTDIVALAEMPPEDVQATGPDPAALHDAAVAWRKAHDERDV